MKKILTLSIAFITIVNLQIGISQSKLDTLQNERLTTIEAKVKTHEELKTTIQIYAGVAMAIFSGIGFALFAIPRNTKKAIEQKQAEVIQKTTEEILKNMSVQLGMPLEQVRAILINADKESKIKEKKIVVFNSDGQQTSAILGGLNAFANRPVFKKMTSEPDVNGFDIAIIYSLDLPQESDKDKQQLADLILQMLAALNGKVEILIAVKQGVIEINRENYKSGIQYANDPQRFEANIKSLYA